MFLPVGTLGLKLFFREILAPGCKSLLLPRRHKQHIPSLDRAACNMTKKKTWGVALVASGRDRRWQLLARTVRNFQTFR